MCPTETDFMAPTFDFFKPKNHPGGSDFVGFKAGERDYFFMIRDNNHSVETRRRMHYYSIPPQTINSIYVNDLGGWSVDFSDDVQYLMNGDDRVLFRVPGEQEPYGISCDIVARIRKNDKNVVWENMNVPKEKKILK